MNFKSGKLVDVVRKLPVLGLLALISALLAVAMNFYLFAFDTKHRSDPAILFLNHVLNTGIWFVVFVFLVFLVYGMLRMAGFAWKYFVRLR